MTTQKDQRPVTRSVARALSILQAFNETRLELGVTEISQLTDLDKSTVYRLLNELQQGGLIEQDPDTSKYYLVWCGWRAWRCNAWNCPALPDPTCEN
jgi:DNA-binding IclR family transcriptional regulator